MSHGTDEDAKAAAVNSAGAFTSSLSTGGGSMNDDLRATSNAANYVAGGASNALNSAGAITSSLSIGGGSNNGAAARVGEGLKGLGGGASIGGGGKNKWKPKL